MSPARMPGPGNSVTWGAPTGHPMDPRSDYSDYCECDLCGHSAPDDWNGWRTKDGALLCEDCAEKGGE